MVCLSALAQGKTPRIGDKEGGRGFKDATRNEKQIREWWTRWPDGNIGFWPGPSGFLAADLDGPECEKLAQEFGLLREPTLICVTGRKDGGRHLYFRSPGFVVGNVMLGAGLRAVTENEGVPYILFRGQDGYVVAAPSIHPDTGVEYRWVGTPGEMCDLPAEVVARLRALATDAVTSTEAPAGPIAGAKLKEESRNNGLTRVAGALVSAHKPPEAAALLYGYNLANCDPPYTRAQCDQIIVNLTKREVRKASRPTEGGHRSLVA